MKLLIVEDSELVRARIIRTLRDERRLSIEVAGTIAEAIDALAGEPDIVSVDLHLPDGSGLDVIQRAKMLPSKPVVYVLTAVPGMRERCMEQGADAVFDKHVDVPAYLTLIRQQLETA